MSDSNAGLRRKIDSAGDLRSVVRTMKAVAAASITQYERSVSALADYYHTVELGLSASLRVLGAASLPTGPAVMRRDAPVGAIVFGSDQGLVGQFNDAIAEHARSTLAALRAPVQVWAVGERAQARLADLGMASAAMFAVPASVSAISALVAQILRATEPLRARSHAAELYLFYHRPSAGAIYAPFSRRLLPLDASWRAELLQLPWPTAALPEVIGAGTTTLEALVGEYLFVSLFRAAAESLASENASRLAAMQRAEKNINGMLEDMNASFHRLRQDSIDEELFDVVSGFESLM